MRVTNKEIKEFVKQYLMQRGIKARVKVTFDPDVGHDVDIIRHWEKDAYANWRLIWEIRKAIIEKFGDRLMKKKDWLNNKSYITYELRVAPFDEEN